MRHTGEVVLLNTILKFLVYWMFIGSTSTSHSFRDSKAIHMAMHKYKAIGVPKKFAFVNFPNDKSLHAYITITVMHLSAVVCIACLLFSQY